MAGGRSAPVAFAGGNRAQTPLAPVHLTAVRVAAGVRLSWTRRGRLDADDWEAADIPLDEPFERYRLEVLDGEEVRRVVETASPYCLYSTADEAADFGSPRSTLRYRVRQMGRAVPLGIAATAEISL
jgi:hypothetical protein